MSGACGDEFRVLVEDGKVEGWRSDAQHLGGVFDFGFFGDLGVEGFLVFGAKTLSSSGLWLPLFLWILSSIDLQIIQGCFTF